MKRTLAALATISAFLLPAAVQAAIIPTLTSVTPNGDGTFTWTYGGTLASDQALLPGDRLVIYDFAGFVPNSIFTSAVPGFGVVGSTQNLTTPEGAILPAIGQSDDPNIPNLIFTYTGPNTVNFEGPFSERELTGFGARSIFSALGMDGFSGDATRNATATGGVPGTPTLNFGSVSVPRATPAVPEPSTWGMMLIGFGLLGAVMRRRKSTTVHGRVRFA